MRHSTRLHLTNGWQFSTAFLLACGLELIATDPPTHAQQPAVGKAAATVSFDRDIRAILDRCVKCHGPGRARAGLRLDSRDGALARLESGRRAIVPGHPEQSELLRRVSIPDPEKRMPLQSKPLGSEQVEALRRWISDGAAWSVHWAYRPLAKPPLPPGALKKGTPRARNPIDLFIAEKLGERGLAPAPAADRRSLLRRVYFDLIGMPPTPEATDDFLADDTPDAYEKVVERLLASPRYGERWARHWMDVVHFAETHGHDQDRPREHAWPYRDYLIRAFNQDMPYARFVEEQVAGDVLFPNDPWATVATGFLASGPWDESSLRDIREDSIDREIGRYLDRDDIVTTVMSTFVSTTVHCARCHDHKFDPISQKEYYALQAVFAGTDKGNRLYDLDSQVADRRRRLTERKAQLARRGEKVDAALQDPALQSEVAVWEKTIAQADRQWQVLESVEHKSAEGATLVRQADGSILSSGKRPDKDTYTVVALTDLQEITGIRLEVLTDDKLPHKGPGRQDNGNLHLNEFTLTAANSPLKKETVSAHERDGPLFTQAERAVVLRSASADFDQQGWAIRNAIDGNPATAWGIYPEVGKPHRAVFVLKEPLRHTGVVRLIFRLQQTHGGGHLIGRFRLSVTDSPQPADVAGLPPTVAVILNVAPAKRTPGQRAELAAYYLGRKLDRDLAALPSQSQVYCGTQTFVPDESHKPSRTPRAIYILKRGDVRNPGPLAQPGTLACLGDLNPRFDLADSNDAGARRAALAHWLTDSRNGLTWRSIANRVWQYHFGRGLVDTPNDFGRMGALPTHAELLDWLAVTLQENGGSLKHLHRLIVTSAAYRQSSQHEPSFAARDGDNHYLWRMNRQRLDAEAIHDAVLQISGKLDAAMGGPSVKQFIQTPGVHVTPNVDYQNFNPDEPANCRRSVYRFVFRTLPDPFMDALDCPDGSQLTPVRSASVTAAQALSMLNDKFMVRQSEHISERIERTAAGLEKQVTAAYRLILGRAPTAKELRAVAAYAARNGLANACRMLLNSNEFVFVD